MANAVLHRRGTMGTASRSVSTVTPTRRFCVITRGCQVVRPRVSNADDDRQHVAVLPGPANGPLSQQQYSDGGTGARLAMD